MRQLSRRDFLLAVGAATGLTAAGAAVIASESDSPKKRRSPADLTPPTIPLASATKIGDGPVVQTAAWVMAENARPGTSEWAITGAAIPHVLEAFADKVSAQAGDTVTLRVSCQDPTFSVAAYRIGWYQGLGGRLVWQSPGPIPGRVQPAPTLRPSTYMVECAWAPSTTLQVTSAWPPGDYLLKLTTSTGQARYVPLVVRDDASRATYVIQNSVTTWQAYNWWGGYCLYYGPSSPGSIYTGPHGAAGEEFNNRSRVVSFDRPYPHDWSYGASDFIGNELPMVMLAERLGLDVTYWTDVDLHERPGLLSQHRCMISLGHDEYWSAPMYDGALSASQGGVNLMFLGANACYRHIRFEASPLGADRHVICYKVATEDPLYGVTNSEVTSDWPASPDPRPGSILIGNMYQSNGIGANGVGPDMVVVDASSWVLSGTGLADGDHVRSILGPEYDGYDPAVTSPTNLSVVAHSPVVGLGGTPGYADLTWFTRSSSRSAGVFATGTNWWVNKMGDNAGRFNPGLVGPPIPDVTSTLLRITENVLGACGSGPAGMPHPSTGNWEQFYPRANPPPDLASNYRTSWPA